MRPSALAAPMAAPTPVLSPMPYPTLVVPAQCTYQKASTGELLPDPGCTPRAINPQVTQATINSTICTSGWTATVRPPDKYASALKPQIMQAYGNDTSRQSSAVGLRAPSGRRNTARSGCNSSYTPTRTGCWISRRPWAFSGVQLHLQPRDQDEVTRPDRRHVEQQASQELESSTAGIPHAGVSHPVELVGRDPRWRDGLLHDHTRILGAYTGRYLALDSVGRACR
jgi:hypothetical protein